MRAFIRACGVSLVLGGALTIMINALITPFMPQAQNSNVMITNIFLVRQVASGFAVLFLLLGTIGLHLAQKPRSGWFGSLAFLVGFIGTALVVAVEFADVFVLRAVAQIAPQTADSLDKSRLLNTGFALAIGSFAIGWLFMSINAWKTKLLPRWAAMATFAGLFLISILQATLGITGAVIGNAIFGGGLMGLGWAVATGKSFSEST